MRAGRAIGLALGLCVGRLLYAGEAVAPGFTLDVRYAPSGMTPSAWATFEAAGLSAAFEARTVERAVKSGATLGVDLMTIHSTGGKAMIRAAAEAAATFGAAAPKILAVTALTSLDQSDLTDLGIARAMADQVEAMGLLAITNGADGIVCSPKEVANMNRVLVPAAAGRKVVFVTPGVRPAGAAVGDQKRVATPAGAVRDGSTHLVVGRPILEAADPVAAARAIRAEMDSALA